MSSESQRTSPSKCWGGFVARFEPFHFGFYEDKEREAAHKAAKAWLAEQKSK